jgi:hypothetical protein
VLDPVWSTIKFIIPQCYNYDKKRYHKRGRAAKYNSINGYMKEAHHRQGDGDLYPGACYNRQAVLRELSTNLASVSDEQHGDLALMLINLVNHPPISYSVAKIPSQPSFEALNVRMLIWGPTQILETTIEFTD